MRASDFLREEDFNGVGQGRFSMPGSEEEVSITIPVTVNIGGTEGGDIDIPTTGGEPGKVNTTIAAPATTKYPSEPIWVFPGQQMLELTKQAGGKTSPVINQIIKSDNGPDSDPDDGVFAELDDDADDANRSVYSSDALKSGY